MKLLAVRSRPSLTALGAGKAGLMATSEPDAGSRRDQVVVSLRGELDIVNTPALGPLAAAAIRGQFVVVDLAGLDFLDCSAVRLLMHAQLVARESGGDVVFANSPGSVLRSLTMPGQADVPAEALAAG
jgi:anti-anti-sigma factor